MIYYTDFRLGDSLQNYYNFFINVTNICTTLQGVFRDYVKLIFISLPKGVGLKHVLSCFFIYERGSKDFKNSKF